MAPARECSQSCTNTPTYSPPCSNYPGQPRWPAADSPRTARARAYPTEVVDGDFFHDALPQGHDAVLIANVMHLFSPDHNKDLLRRIRASVAAGARLLLADFWTDPTHSEPAFAALMAGEFLVITGEGDVYSAQEVKDWLDQTGRRIIDRTPLAGPMSLLIAEAVG